MVGEHTLYFFFPFKCNEVYFMAYHMVCPGPLFLAIAEESSEHGESEYEKKALSNWVLSLVFQLTNNMDLESPFFSFEIQFSHFYKEDLLKLEG